MRRALSIALLVLLVVLPLTLATPSIDLNEAEPRPLLDGVPVTITVQIHYEAGDETFVLETTTDDLEGVYLSLGMGPSGLFKVLLRLGLKPHLAWQTYTSLIGRGLRYG